MYYNEYTKMILAKNRNTFRALHDTFAFDFEKPYAIIYFDGPFTINKAIKAANNAGYNGKFNAAMLIECDEARRWRDNYNYNCIKINPYSGDFDIDIKVSYYSNRSGFDKFYTKGSFNDARKEKDVKAFLICQKNEYANKRQKQPIDYNARYNWEKPSKDKWSRTMVSDGRGNRWIGCIKLQKRDEKGGYIELDTSKFPYYPKAPYHPQEITEIIDKSGYILRPRRFEWQEKAKQLRAERKKAKYQMQDNRVQIEELRGLIDTRKAALIEQLEAANTSNDLRMVADAIGRWGGFSGIVGDFERFQHKTETKEYPSIEDSEKEYTYIKKRLTKEA